MAWKEICRPVSQGGLGVRNLRWSNQALLARWVGRIMGTEEDIWSSVFFACNGRDLCWDSRTRLPRGASSFWRGVSALFPVMRPLMHTSLGSGVDFSF